MEESNACTSDTAKRPSAARRLITSPLESVELGDVAGFEFLEAFHAEQLHRANDLVGKDLDGTVDARSSSGHEPVEVGAADQCEPGTEGDRCDDVGAGHDAGVDGHLDIAAEFAHDGGQEMERHRGAIELSPPVVRQQNAVDAEVAAGRMSAPLPVGLLDPSADVAADVDDSLELGALREQVAPDVLRHWLAREIWRRQPATRLRPRGRPELGPSPLEFTPGPLLWLTPVGDRAVLGLGDRLLDLPFEAYDFLAGMLESEGTFRPNELEGLDEASRDVVLRRLLNEGVIAPVE